MQKIKVYYLDNSEEVLEGTVTIANGCFKVEKPVEEDQDSVIAMVNVTNSIYIPLTAVRKIQTLN